MSERSNWNRKLESRFKRILEFAPPKISALQASMTAEEIYNDLYENYVLPIAEDIERSTCSVDAFTAPLIELGLDIGNKYYIDNLNALVKFWLTSGEWQAKDKSRTVGNALARSWLTNGKWQEESQSRTVGREKAFEDLLSCQGCDNYLNLETFTDKTFWSFVNDSLFNWMYFRAECLSLGAVNTPYFLTFLAYEVLIELRQRRLGEKIDIEDRFAHFKASTWYIHEKEKNKNKKVNKESNHRLTKSVKLEHLSTFKLIKQVVIELSEKTDIIWASVFSKQIHFIAEKPENLTTKDYQVRQRNGDLLSAVIEEVSDQYKVDTTVEAINSGFCQFNDYVGRSHADQLGCDTQARGGKLINPEQIFYGWGQAFYEMVMASINSVTTDEVDRQLIKHFILRRLLSVNTPKHEFNHKRMKALHDGCVHLIKAPVYWDIHELIDKNWGYTDSRAFIRQQF